MAGVNSKRGATEAEKDCDEEQREWMKEPKILFSEDSGIRYTWDLTVNDDEDIVAVSEIIIQVYNSEGKPKERIDCNQLRNAWNVVAKGDTLYVSNREANGNILVMDFKGNVKKTITLPETEQSYEHKGLAVDDEGSVYISSFGTHAIYKCERNESKANVFIPQGAHPDLRSPWYLCVTHNCELVVSNNESQTVQMYDRGGKFLWQYRGQGDKTLRYPNGICCDRYGYVYISDRFNHRLQIVRNGKFQKYLMMQGFYYPYGICLDKDFNIVCGFNDGTKITKLKVWERQN